MRRTKYALMSMLMFLVLLGCGISNETTVTTPPAVGPSSPISVDLEMEKAPRLEEAVTLTCTVKSIGYDGPASTASIELPEGAVLVNGDLKWEGDLKADIPIQFTATIKFVKEGYWKIKAVANRVVNEYSIWGDMDSIFLRVTEESGEFGWFDRDDPGQPAMKEESE